MNYKKLVIVGDKFNEFANGKDVLTISQLELLSQISANIIDKEHEIIIGQGVRKDFAGKVISNQARNVVHGNKLKMCSLEKLVRDKKMHIVIKGWSRMFLSAQQSRPNITVIFLQCRC